MVKVRKSRTLFSIFLPSPFARLVEHARRGGELVRKLREAVLAFCEGDERRVRELAEEISRGEHEVDEVKSEIRRNLPRGILLPVDRSDLLAFLKPQDSIADFAEDAAHMLTLRRPERLPEGVRVKLLELVEGVIRTVDAYVEVVGRLSKVARFSFRQRDIKEALEAIPRVEELEHETDVIGMELGRMIFASEGELGPVGVYHLNELAKTIGEIADCAARAADRLRTMLTRR